MFASRRTGGSDNVKDPEEECDDGNTVTEVASMVMKLAKSAPLIVGWKTAGFGSVEMAS